jgi:diketogulonate reductase-like aldo/keto reductase
VIVQAIVEAGYRHIDTASKYGNEEMIGEAIQEAMKAKDIKREEFFITTKIWFEEYGDPEAAIRGSLKRLKLEYVDLYLIHWPVGLFSEPKKPLHVLWKELESLVDKGLTKSIGLSNFNMQLILDLLCYARIKPVSNQIELNPHCAQSNFLKFLKDQNILPLAYAPLGSPLNLKEEGKMKKIPLFDEPTLINLSEKYNKPIQ